MSEKTESQETNELLQPIELSIVMPCLNEAETLATCIQKAQEMLNKHKIVGEIIIADNGSTDDSPKIANRLGARVIYISEKGYGNALMGGINAAHGKYIIMGDADDSYDFTDLSPFIKMLRNDYDLVMGNRFKGGIKRGAMPLLHKYIGNPILTGIGRLFFRSPCGDFHCGLRGFKKDAIMQLNLRSTGMEFASELVVKATLLGLRICEVPTTLSPDGRNRPPHLRSWHDGWRHLRFLLLYSPRWLFLYPGIILIALGLIIGLLVLPGPLTIGSVTLDVHTLLMASLTILCGYQSIIFAICAKIFAITEGLLPEDRHLNVLFKFVNLERGLLLGGIIMLAGMVLITTSIIQWQQVSFGPLNYTYTMRFVIPGATLITLGFQTILSSFFLSILGLKRK